MAAVSSIPVGQDESGLRLDRWFKRRYPALSHGQLERLLRTGQVRLDGKRAKSNQRIEAGQVIRVPPLSEDSAKQPRPAPQVQMAPEVSKELQGWVLHRDDDVIVIDKPAGLAVQGGTKTGRHLDAMLDGLRFGSEHRPRLVHRLDKDTSGVLVLARNPAAASALTEAFRTKDAQKLYWAIVVGLPNPEARHHRPAARQGRRRAGGAGGRPRGGRQAGDNRFPASLTMPDGARPGWPWRRRPGGPTSCASTCWPWVRRFLATANTAGARPFSMPRGSAGSFICMPAACGCHIRAADESSRFRPRLRRHFQAAVRMLGFDPALLRATEDLP